MFAKLFKRLSSIYHPQRHLTECNKCREIAWQYERVIRSGINLNTLIPPDNFSIIREAMTNGRTMTRMLRSGDFIIDININANRVETTTRTIVNVVRYSTLMIGVLTTLRINVSDMSYNMTAHIARLRHTLCYEGLYSRVDLVLTGLGELFVGLDDNIDQHASEYPSQQEFYTFAMKYRKQCIDFEIHNFEQMLS